MAPALLSETAPNDVSRKYVPNIRSDDLTIVAPACAVATAQKTREASIAFMEGSTVREKAAQKCAVRWAKDC